MRTAPHHQSSTVPPEDIPISTEVFRQAARLYPAEVREHYEHDAERFAAVARHLYVPGGTLVDLGSGFSPLALGLQRCGMQTTMVDLFDYPVDLHNVAQPEEVLSMLRAAGVGTVLFDLQGSEPLPFDDGSVDSVSCLAVIEHFHHSPRPFFREIHRILRPGGRLVIGCPNAVNLRKRASVLFGRSNLPSVSSFWNLGDPQWYGHVREPTLDEMVWMVRESGFDVLNTFGLNVIGILNYGLLCKIADPLLRIAPGLCSDIFVVAEKGRI